jgi:hypothetical protein
MTLSAGLVVSSKGVAFGGLVVIVFAIGPKVRGFKLGRRRWISNGDTNL